MNYIKENTTRRKVLMWLSSILTIVVFTLLLLPLNNYVANADDQSKEEIDKEYGKYAKDLDYNYEVVGKFNKDVPKGRESTFTYVLSRVFRPGYINDVSDAYIPNKLKDNGTLVDNKYACNKSAPANLISSNCTVPNFSAQLGQGIMRAIYPSGIVNGERKAAKPLFNWGVPDSIPNGTVPIDPAQRNSKYTGLELFGYNATFSSYNGEWDDIMPSTRARMLANYGLMDNINLTGTSIWEGIKETTNSAVEGFSWNPLTWLGNIIDAFEAGGSKSMIVIIDSSDANVLTTRGWVRSGSSVGSSFYNIYVLSDKEIMDYATINLANKVSEALSSDAKNNQELQDILSLEQPPVFTYDPKKETDESKKAIEAAKKKNKEIDEYNKEVEIYNSKHDDKKPKKEHVKVPEPVYQSEEDQFKEWLGKDKGVKKGKDKGIDCGDSETYDDFTACWADKFESVKKENFNVGSSIMKPILDAIEKNLFKDDPYADTTKAISHYVCADDEGRPMKKSDGSYEYAYLAENDGAQESINPKCKAIRPVLQGGFFGNGYEKEITDTRHISNVPGATIFSILPFYDGGSQKLQSLGMSLSKFNAQIINEMMNLAFSPLMDKLGVTTIVQKTITSFKDTIFFPLVSAVIMFAALAMFWDAIQSRSLKKFLTSFFGLLLVFFIGVVMLNSPQNLIKLFDEFPSKVEQKLATVIMNQDKSDGLCSTDSRDSNAGVRSAQCHVWSTLIYQPWSYGQFGSAPSRLNANGYGEGLKNKNTELVGNAEVNLGGGEVIHNWAAYQMQLMTSGTITERDPKKPVGVTDKNLYRVVDAQAGPNNGKESDGTFFYEWTGFGAGRVGTALQAAVLSVFMLITIGSILLLKIQLTFTFSILMMALPFMLLFGLTPKGKLKLLEYAGTMFSLLLKRFVSVVMISIMLLLLNTSIPDSADSYNTVFFVSLIVLGFFWLYKHEILKMFNLTDAQSKSGLLSGDPHEIKKTIMQGLPKNLQQHASMGAAKVRGTVAGGVGGAVAGFSHAAKNLGADYEANGGKFSAQTPLQSMGKLLNGSIDGMKHGAGTGKQSTTTRESNKQLRTGLHTTQALNQARAEVRRQGAQSIIDGQEELERDLYKESQTGRNVVTEEGLNEVGKKGQFDKEELLDAKTQKAIRKAADEARKGLYVTRRGKGYDSNQVLDRLDEAEDMSEMTKRQDEILEKDVRISTFKHPINVDNRVQAFEQNDSSAQTSKDVNEYIERHADEAEERFRDRIAREEEEAKAKAKAESEAQGNGEQTLDVPNVEMVETPVEEEILLKVNTNMENANAVAARFKGRINTANETKHIEVDNETHITEENINEVNIEDVTEYDDNGNPVVVDTSGTESINHIINQTVNHNNTIDENNQHSTITRTEEMIDSEDIGNNEDEANIDLGEVSGSTSSIINRATRNQVNRNVDKGNEEHEDFTNDGEEAEEVNLDETPATDGIKSTLINRATKPEAEETEDKLTDVQENEEENLDTDSDSEEEVEPTTSPITRIRPMLKRNSVKEDLQSMQEDSEPDELDKMLEEQVEQPTKTQNINTKRSRQTEEKVETFEGKVEEVETDNGPTDVEVEKIEKSETPKESKEEKKEEKEIRILKPTVKKDALNRLKDNAMVKNSVIEDKSRLNKFREEVGEEVEKPKDEKKSTEKDSSEEVDEKVTTKKRNIFNAFSKKKTVDENPTTGKQSTEPTKNNKNKSSKTKESDIDNDSNQEVETQVETEDSLENLKSKLKGGKKDDEKN